jgi:hypothetical protein
LVLSSARRTRRDGAEWVRLLVRFFCDAFPFRPNVDEDFPRSPLRHIGLLSFSGALIDLGVLADAARCQILVCSS